MRRRGCEPQRARKIEPQRAHKIEFQRARKIEPQSCLVSELIYNAIFKVQRLGFIMVRVWERDWE